MLAGFLLGIVHDRRLMREAQVNLAMRWFAGYGLQDRLPDHSSLTRLRQRWGAERFRRIFERTVQACVAARIAALSLSPSRVTKAVVIVHDYPALLRARRRRERWSREDDRLYRRHRWRSEGFHGEAKTWHGLARAVRRGLENMRIQAFLNAAAINLKRLAAALLAVIHALLRRHGRNLTARTSRPDQIRPPHVAENVRGSTDRRRQLLQQPPRPLHAQRARPCRQERPACGLGLRRHRLRPERRGQRQAAVAPCR
jgi:hypothetical protein